MQEKFVLQSACRNIVVVDEESAGYDVNLVIRKLENTFTRVITAQYLDYLFITIFTCITPGLPAVHHQSYLFNTWVLLITNIPLINPEHCPSLSFLIALTKGDCATRLGISQPAQAISRYNRLHQQYILRCNSRVDDIARSLQM